MNCRFVYARGGLFFSKNTPLSKKGFSTKKPVSESLKEGLFLLKVLFYFHST
jgi:hypothetical protein